MTHADYVDGLKNTLLWLIPEQAFKFIVGKFAFLAWGPVGWLLKFFLEKITMVIIYKTDMAIFITFIDVRSSTQGRAFHDAIEENIRAQRDGTEEDKRAAKSLVIDRFRNFVKLTN